MLKNLCKGAIIIDVRTIGKFKEGHIKNSKNIPLDTVALKISEIKKVNKLVIFVVIRALEVFKLLVSLNQTQ